jgi:uncharacterized protein YlxW (UPF0749 family)
MENKAQANLSDRIENLENIVYNLRRNKNTTKKWLNEHWLLIK